MSKISPSVLGVFVGITASTCLLAHVEGAPPPQYKWTVMVYISGDNDLEAAVVRDIEQELGLTGSTEDVQVIALADRGPGYDTSRGDWQGTLLFHVTPGIVASAEQAVEDWGERNMGDAQTLIDLVTWTKLNYPADHYALYFWGHGWSWHPDYVMKDETDDDTLDANELKSALPTLGFIDFVGYDGCNMASIEVDALWHNYATALAHSQEWVGWNGIEYDVVLAQLAANPGMTADEVAIATSESADTDNTWSAVAVDDRFDDLLSAVDAWSVALKHGLPRHKADYRAAFTATQTFWQAPMDKDLYDMANEISLNVDDPHIQAASQDVMDAVNAVVLYERHLPAYENAHGITIYHPSKIQQQVDHFYYLSLDFSIETRWNEFISAYLH